MSLRISATGLGFAVKYNRPHRFVPVTRNTKTYCTVPVPNKKPEMNQEQEKKKPSEQDSKNTVEDVMTQSFGEGYRTRCDEEGFGGIYGQNDPNENHDHRVNHPDYDKSQGCEVKEKEKARNARDGAKARNARDGAHTA